jgi:hypothetical protein
MNDFLNQLVGLCAGRGGRLRLERRQLLEEFKRLPDKYEHKDECLSDCQLCMDVVSASANTGEDFERPSFLKSWEQPNHGITFRHRRKFPHFEKSIRSNSSVKVLNPLALLQIRPINPIWVPTQQAEQLQNFTIPPTWSGEHRTSFPPILLPVTSVLSRPNTVKIGRGHNEAAKKLTDANGPEVLKSSWGGNEFPTTVTESHRFHIEATIGPTHTINLRRRNTEPVLLDKFEADMKILTIKLIRERRVRREIVLGGPKNRHRVRVEVDAASTSPEEMEQARQLTTFRGDCGLQYQFLDAGKVDVYKDTRGTRGRPGRCYHGWGR